MHCLTSFLRFAKQFFAQFALLALISEQFIFAASAYADLPLAADGSTNTSIDRAQNSVPIVNIAAPNSGGLSHNKFSDFNVDSAGLILNNATRSTDGITLTQIGGLINDNPNLATSGAASVILNEVTSNRISQVNGYVEIAGKKADLILANPNGISFAGAGFINVSRFSAVVGSTNPTLGGLNFSLSSASGDFLPKLVISGSGLNLENVPIADLVASSMQILSPIYAGNNQINLRSGDQNFNYASWLM